MLQAEQTGNFSQRTMNGLAPACFSFDKIQCKTPVSKRTLRTIKKGLNLCCMGTGIVEPRQMSTPGKKLKPGLWHLLEQAMPQSHIAERIVFAPQPEDRAFNPLEVFQTQDKFRFHAAPFEDIPDTGYFVSHRIRLIGKCQIPLQEYLPDLAVAQ